MPGIPENQQSGDSKPTQGPAIPVFTQSAVIGWEYEIVLARRQPAGDAGFTAAPFSNESAPEMAFGAVQQPQPGSFVQSGAFHPPEKKLPVPLIAGVAVFAVIIAGLLISGLLRYYNGSVPADTGVSANSSANSSPSAASVAGRLGEMTEAQKTFAAALFEKLPGALVRMSKQFTQDPVFLEAVSQAKLTDLAFGDGQMDFNIMLPDPRAESLDQLGVASYTPHSGAQAYIRDNYTRLCNMDQMTTCVLVQAKLYPKQNADGSLIVDWSLPELNFALYNYEQLFTPQVAEYMKDKGFFTAAMELMMPDFQNWDAHTGTERDMTQLEEYFRSLAVALAPKGITLNEKTVVDVDTIEQTLKARLVNTWAFDSPDIQTSGYHPMFTFRTDQEAWFQDASDELDAQYEAGAKPRPADLNALEAGYLENVRRKINDAYDSNGLQGNNVYNMQYAFTWQELGEKGIAACPDLVEEIRRYLFGYDFSLMFTARTALEGSYY
jgi:hypothetical protein